MPSWNIHTAHVERLLREGEPLGYGIRDVNAFLFGNLLPDVYVGYMVPGTSRTIPYGETHLADPFFMPTPDTDRFWREYVEPISSAASCDPAASAAPCDPAASAAPCVVDVILGAWAHLVADRLYNSAARLVVADKNLEPGDPVRVLKQADFDAFGRTLDISAVPEANEGLVRACAAFPQYPIDAADVVRACDAAANVVRLNAERHLAGEPDYALLDDSFFENTFEQVNDTVARGLRARAAALGLR